MSKQRALIYSIVASTTAHPTADWVYQQARRRMKHISLGTVYRNLKTLRDEGMLSEITTVKGPARYDGNTARHSHLRCTRCDRLEDLPEKDYRLISRSKRIERFHITDYRVELVGICPDCRKN